LAEPGFRRDLAEPRVVARNECAFVHLDPVIAGARVGDNGARIVVDAETLPDEEVERELLGPGDFDDAIHRRALGNPPHCGGDIVCRHRLDQYRCQPHRRAVGGGIVVFAAILATAWLSIAVRHQPRAFVPSLVALVSLAGTQVIFWSLTFPVNRATVNWTALPANWSELRGQREYSHALAAVLNLIAFVATMMAVLRHRAGPQDR
jgi:hypothetical protein